MKSISSMQLLLACLVVLFVSGCASLDTVFSEAPEKPEAAQQSSDLAKETEQASEGGAAQGEQAQVVVDPLQQKVAELRAMPNLYLSGSPSVDETAKRQFRQAVTAKQENKPKVAETILLDLTQSQPGLSGPWVILGDLKMDAYTALPNSKWDQKQELLQQAKTSFEKAIKANQHNYFAHNRLARVLRELGLFEQAEAHYKKAIASWPAYDNAYLNLGILYDLYTDKKAQALSQFELYQALQEKPSRQVRGWIADLKRQVRTASAGGAQ
ncbi:tetratricopeptide repeat protein [Aliiglaciecola sp. M165]|uniref:tetratricopeptide repeat protein n=1 Tax=Aliiglaciecola sp. M165 TaxID=2593649 RepID=UPI00117C5E76|nr:tetratricopeptide repeat protein [Aliiglaciecola sp. M165]TRY31973.1 hypothetical protein FM019_09070 [Aliiglaciecola sp. M165]